MPKATLNVEVSGKELRDAVVDLAKATFKDKPLGGASIILHAPVVSSRSVADQIMDAFKQHTEDEISKDMLSAMIQKLTSGFADTIISNIQANVIFDAR